MKTKQLLSLTLLMVLSVSLWANTRDTIPVSPWGITPLRNLRNYDSKTPVGKLGQMFGIIPYSSNAKDTLPGLVPVYVLNDSTVLIGSQTVVHTGNIGSYAPGTNLGYVDTTRLLTSSTGTDVTLPLVTASAAGLAPATGGDTLHFLRADGQWKTPLGTINSINGQTGPAQTFSVDSTGYTFSITSSANNHKFSIPTASELVGRGLLTNGAQTIAGAKTFNSGIRTINGTANANAVQPSASSGNGIHFPSGTDFAIATNALTRLQILQNGRVGINTTTPSQRLHVNGAVRVDSLATVTPTTLLGDASGVLGRVTVGSGLSLTGGTLVATSGGGGTVTSVGLTMPTGFSVSNSPVTTAGTIGVTTTLNGPLRGNGSGFTTGNTNLASEVTGTLPTVNGGTGLATIGTAGQVLRVNSNATALEYGTVVGGSGASGRVAYWNGSSSVTSDANFLYDGRLTIGTNAHSNYAKVYSLGSGIQASFFGASVDNGTTPPAGYDNPQMLLSNLSANNNTWTKFYFSGRNDSGGPVAALATLIEHRDYSRGRFGIHMTPNGATYTEVFSVSWQNRVGILNTSPTAILHIGAGSTAANTAPLKLTSGSLNTTPEVGALEFLTDRLYFTKTTGTTRETLAYLSDVPTNTLSGTGPAGTSGPRRLAFWKTNNTLDDHAQLVFDTVNVRLGLRKSTAGRTLDVGGAVRIDSLNAVTPTAIVGDAGGVLSRITTGSGLSLTGGTLSVTHVPKDTQYVHLIAVPPGTAVTQTAGHRFENATFLVHDNLNGYQIRWIRYAFTNNTSSSGSLQLAWRKYDTTNTITNDNFNTTLSGSVTRAGVTAASTVATNDVYTLHVNTGTGGTLNGTVEGLIVTVMLVR